MVESGFYAQPSSYEEFPNALSDDKLLYSVHVYEPYAFTSNGNFRNGATYAYPGNIPFGDGIVWWDKNTLDAYFEPFEGWIKTHRIPVQKIVVSEFGCMRRNPGAEQYLADMVSLLEDKNYHWAFYAFREDGWDDYDYEIGTGALPWAYWQARERGEFPAPPRGPNALFNAHDGPWWGENAGWIVPGIGKEDARRPGFKDGSLEHERHPVRYFSGKALIRVGRMSECYAKFALDFSGILIIDNIYPI